MQIAIGSVHILLVSISLSVSVYVGVWTTKFESDRAPQRLFATLGTQTLSVNKPEMFRYVIVEQLNILEC